MGSFTKEVSKFSLISIDNDYVYFNLLYLFVYLAPRGIFFSHNAPPLDVLQR